MKVYIEKQFRKLPNVARIWIKPNAGRFKEMYCFGIKTGDEVRIETTNQIIYPRKLQSALIAEEIDTTNFFPQTIKTEIMSTTTIKKKATKVKKSATKKSAPKKVAKKTGRPANVESVASKIAALYAKGKTNLEISEALGCPNKYVCDVTWRINNPGGKKKKSK